MTSADDSDFLEVGSLQPFEARRILPRLVQEKIRFQIGVDDGPLKRMGGVTAAYGGAWGNASRIRLFVHQEDGKKAGKIFGEFFKV
ncbi:MAG TPA: hypothetical protein VHD32_04260 [Candidatus Didemnitutus sp.]|nr:hypothetical protein [Candidatus Didemnitutus sp.]